MFKLIRRLLLVFTVLVVVAGAVLFGQYQAFRQAPLALPEAGVDFVVEPGDSVRSIARQWQRRGWLAHHPAFVEWLARSRGLATRIKTGEYRLRAGTTAESALEMLAAGLVRQYRLTVIEGWTFAEMLRAVQGHAAIEARIETPDDHAAIMAGIDGAVDYAEGWFLPDTYAFPRGTSDQEFLRRAHRAMVRYLEAAWAGRAEDLPLESPEQALILASIIEKETGVAEERGQIAGVFVERLERGMRLQTDPTVIYGMGEAFDGDIRFRDLRRDTPYNTYTRHGLPPTPIALPGREAIDAALHPERTGALYFVARGDGTHQFSATLEEHNRAVARYQLNR